MDMQRLIDRAASIKRGTYLLRQMESPHPSTGVEEMNDVASGLRPSRAVSSPEAAGRDDVAEKLNFEIGYAIACANIVALHGETVIASDVLSEVFDDRASVYRLADWSDYDRDSFRTLFKCEASRWPYRVKKARTVKAEPPLPATNGE